MNYDAIVPFSHFLNPDKTPDKITQQRLDHALDFFLIDAAPFLFIPGGDAQKLGISLSESMKRYAILRGAPEEKILTETDSLDTIGQIIRARVILEKRGLRRILWVSDTLHIERVRLLVAFIWPQAMSDFSATPSDFETEAYKMAEKESLAAFERTYQGIAPGDLKAIAERTCAQHSLYLGRLPASFLDAGLD